MNAMSAAAEAIARFRERSDATARALQSKRDARDTTWDRAANPEQFDANGKRVTPVRRDLRQK